MKQDSIELSVLQVGAITLILGLVGGFGAAHATSLGMIPENPDKFAEEQPQQNSGSQTPEEVFRQISNDLDLDTDTVMQCYQESDNSEAEEDRANALRNLGNFGTPTFFVGNRDKGFVKLTGAQPLPRFEEAMNTVQQDNPGNLTSLEGIEFEGEPSKGNENASIKVVEFNEFGCPFCAEWQGIDASGRTPIDKMKIADSLESQYIDTGEVEFISKDYPVPQLHPNGPMAHQVANCVYEHEQDSYWDFHDELFERRDQWMQG